MSLHHRIAAITAALLLLTAGVAFAHAELESTSPKNGATVGKTRSRVTVTFGEPLRSGSITVTGPAGVVSKGSGGRDPRSVRRVLVGLRTPLASGWYTARWRAVAADGHRQSGSFRFKVRG